MVVDGSSGGIHKYLYLYGCHEPECTKILEKIVPSCARVVDVGANIGYYVLIEARLAHKVYAIEPEPGNLELLRKNIALNSYEDRVEVYQLAISDRTGKTFLAVSDIANRHRLIKPSEEPNDRDIEVITVTLDEFLKDKEVDVIRMDLEGAEWLVINGMKELLSKTSKPLILFIEVHPMLINDYGGDVVLMLELLFDCDFKISHLVMFEPLDTVSFIRHFTARGFSRHEAIEFNPPIDKHALNKKLVQILYNSQQYCLFMKRA